nr:hypothetical protein BaRGS_026302 [Batillaria attramentaria]
MRASMAAKRQRLEVKQKQSFLQHMSDKFASKTTEKDLRTSQKACYQLDTENGNEAPVETFHWPANWRLQAQEEEEEEAEEEEEEAEDEGQALTMVGQYLTEEEQQQKADDALDPSDCRLSTILLKHMENVQEKSLYKQQKDKEECQEEESEESSEEDEDKEDADSEMEEDEEIPEISNERATDIWRQQLRSEFKSLMQEKFMSGKDADFDYSKIDSNPEYDSLTAEGQDDEDRYFFTENPGNAGSYGNSDGDMDCAESQSKTGNTGKDENDDEEEDYMKYEPSAELVSKSDFGTYAFHKGEIRNYSAKNFIGFQV